MQDFRNLRVWQESHRFTLSVYRATKHFPAEERFGLTSQLRRSASSIPANLAEGTGRGSDADFARFVQIAIGSANEAEYQLLLAHDLGYLATDEYEARTGDIQRIKHMLIALLKKLTAHSL